MYAYARLIVHGPRDASAKVTVLPYQKGVRPPWGIR